MKWLAAPLLALTLIGCGGDVPIEPEEPNQPRYIGQITSLHLAQGFVLIRRAPGVTLPTGSILISRGPGLVEGTKTPRVANLRITGETLGQLTAADVQSGAPQVGDSVYEPLLESPEAAPALTPDPETENP